MDVTIIIGNSDDKLSQEMWSDFASKIENQIKAFAQNIYFSGSPIGTAKWQNFAMNFAILERSIPELQLRLTEIRQSYSQDSIAWLEGVTKFI